LRQFPGIRLRPMRYSFHFIKRHSHGRGDLIRTVSSFSHPKNLRAAAHIDGLPGRRQGSRRGDHRGLVHGFSAFFTELMKFIEKFRDRVLQLLPALFLPVDFPVKFTFEQHEQAYREAQSEGERQIGHNGQQQLVHTYRPPVSSAACAAARCGLRFEEFELRSYPQPRRPLPGQSRSC
jgi:hypothetical protein